jgi:hypothetical protein
MKDESDKWKGGLKNKFQGIRIISEMKPRDLIVVMLAVIASWTVGAYIGSSIFNYRNDHSQENKTVPLPIQKAELIPENKAESLTALIDTANWKTYRSQKYEFEIKYPKDWPVPKIESLSNSKSEYEQKIAFNGFNILIRNISKSAESSKCDKSNNSASGYVLAAYQTDYAKLNNYPIENKSCASREVHIIKDKYYFRKVFVYHVIKGKYAYDVVPTEENKNNGNNYVSVLALNKDSSELNSILSTFKFKSADPIISRPRIVHALKISCPKGDDHPSMSDTKGKHMDEDCCPDPDEWPKPGCIYSAKGYSIMLSGAPKKK